MRIKSLLFILSGILSLALMISVPEAAQEDIYIIINPQIDVKNLGANMLKDIYTNNKTKWESGDKIYITLLKKGPVHETFARQMIGMPPKELISLWKKVIFTGVGTPPKVVSTEEAMIRYVASKKGAIGYISGSTPVQGVTAFKVK